MGSKRKPFIIAKAVSESLLKSGDMNGWDDSEVEEIWNLASIQLSDSDVSAAFDEILSDTQCVCVFARRLYKVDGNETLRIARGADSVSNPINVLTERLRALIKAEWPWPKPVTQHYTWHDFTASLLKTLMVKGVVPRHLKIKQLEDDFGI
ncbi:hypothetical protein QVM62_18500 [Pseudomonas putida]|uniref:hypothetical protein n=1 Tax=Pseudomonas TaxID=286 RepID=UPI003523C896